MANQVTNYKCPACTGPLRFDGATGKMKCEYCDSIFSLDEIEKMFAEQDKAAADTMAAAEEKAAEEPAGDEWECTSGEWKEKGMKSYSCPSCGAELIVNETTAATSCPYCGNTTMVPGQVSGTLKPEFVIPFKLDKQKAEEKLKEYYKGKPFLPNAFISGNHIQEIKGVYVPFWLYDGKAHAYGSYDAQKIKTHREGDFEVTVTEEFRVDRAGDIAFEKIPADASSQMPDDIMDSIEPYNYSELTEFSSAYLAGYMADKYDVSAEENADRAVSRAKQSALNAIKSDVKGYDRVTPIDERATVKQGKVSYAMLPVWMLSTKWNDQNFLFAMNGQSGRFVGALPIDKRKVTTTFLAIAVVLAALMGAFCFLTGQELNAMMIVVQFLLLPLGIAAIGTLILKGKMNNVAKAVSASRYVTEGGMTFTRRNDRFIRRSETRKRIEKPASSGGPGRK